MKRYLKIGEESTFGQAASSYPFVLDPVSVSLDSPSDPFTRYPGIASLRSSQLLVPSRYMPEGDIEFGVDFSSIGLILKTFFNRWTTEGTAGLAATTMAYSANASATSIEVNEETGFSAGDKVQIGSASQDPEVVEINALDGGAGATFIWTLQQPLQKDHDAGEEVAEVEGPFVHKFRVLDDPVDALPSVTLKLGKDLMEHEFRGSVFDSLSFSSGNDFLSCSASVKSQKDLKTTPDAVPQTFSDDFVHWAHNTSVRFVTSSEELKTYGLGLTLELSNNIPGDRAFRFGSRFPSRFTPGAFDVNGTLTLAFETMEGYERFWGAASGPSENAVTKEQFAIEFVKDTDTHLSFHFPSVFLSSVAAAMSGRDLITQEVGFEGLYSGAAGWDTPVIVELKNNISRY